MYIGSLTDKNSPIGVSYYYTERGMNNIIYPTLEPETDEKTNYGYDGKLIEDFIGFSRKVIGHSGFDVHFLFEKECFCDCIVFEQKPYSQIKQITAYSVDENGERAVGRLVGACGRNITATAKKANCKADGTILYDENDSLDYATIKVETSVNSKHIILRIEADYLDIVIGKLKIFGASDLDEAIWPLPRSMELKDSYLENITGICVKDPIALAGAKYFEDGFENAKICDSGNIVFEPKDMADEGFEIEVTKDSAKVYANSKRGFIYGAAKLLQLCIKEGIRCALIKDAPFMEIRGAHVGLPAKKDLEFFKRLVKYVYVPLGYNTVIIQLSALMEYKRHPKINEAWREAVKHYLDGTRPHPAHFGFLGDEPYTQDEIREICAYIRSFGLEIVPEIQYFSHSQYVTMAYPHLAEPDEQFYKRCLCPSREDFYKVWFDIIDEAVEVLNPEKFVHIGQDEIVTYGICDKCSKIPHEKLFADAIIRVNNHVKSKGLRAMMWSDMIGDEEYSIPAAIDLIPKDILCLPFTWYFDLEKDTEELVSKHGFEFIIGNFYSSHFRRFNKRKQTPGWRGAQVSAWVECSEDVYCYEGKIFELIYSSNMMWNETYHEEMRNTYTVPASDFASKAMKKIRQNNADFKLAKKLEIEKSWRSVPCEIRYEVEGAIKVSAGQNKRVELKTKAHNLWFVQSTDRSAGRIAWKDLHSIGHYNVIYADGTSEMATICYGRDIAEYERAYAKPISSPTFRHEGYFATCYSEPIMSKTEFGTDYTLYARLWHNPHPEKDIVAVELCHENVNDASIMLFDIFAD